MIMFKFSHLYNLYEIQLYSFQQQLYSIISLQHGGFIIVKLISLFCIGIFTSLNPCFISILPLSFSYISSRGNSNINKNMFNLGLISSFIILTVLLFLFNYQIHTFILNVPLISNFILIFISLNLLEVFDLSFLFFFINTKNNIFLTNSILQIYTAGFIVGLSFIPCNISFILTILFWLSSSDNLLQSLLYFLIYLCGFILPLILIFNISLSNIKLNIFIKLWNNLIPLSSFCILSISVYSLLDQIFSNYI